MSLCRKPCWLWVLPVRGCCHDRCPRTYLLPFFWPMFFLDPRYLCPFLLSKCFLLPPFHSGSLGTVQLLSGVALPSPSVFYMSLLMSFTTSSFVPGSLFLLLFLPILVRQPSPLKLNTTICLRPATSSTKTATSLHPFHLNTNPSPLVSTQVLPHPEPGVLDPHSPHTSVPASKLSTVLRHGAIARLLLADKTRPIN